MKKSRYFLKRTKLALATSGIFIFIGVLLLSISSALICFTIWANNFEIDESLLPMSKNIPVFYDTNGNKMNYEEKTLLLPDDIPTNLKNAFIALEDKRFYKHSGFDTYRILSATLKNIKSGRALEGASTITQQLVKNTHLSSEKTMSRKLKEIALAQKIEKTYDKDQILSMYLSVIYFGGGAYGVQEASKTYFLKSIDELTLAESATLAGIIKNPTKYSPFNNPENSVLRRNQVLKIMFDQGFIGEQEYAIAKNEKLTTVETKTNNFSKFYIDMAIKEACDVLGITKHQLYNSGYKIYTAYNPIFQKTLVENSNLSRNFQKPNTDNSSIILDNKTGYVLAYHSSLGYEVKRQLGSTIKPIVVYAPALEKKIVNLATPIDDSRIQYGEWSPKNYGDKYVGISNPRYGIMQSSNTVAVKIGSYIGENSMYDFGSAFHLDLDESDKNLAIALGSTKKGQTPVALAGAYAAFANYGEYKSPSFIKAIIAEDKKIYGRDEFAHKIISPETAFMITDCLIDTVNDGTAKTLSSLPFEVASKTGTVSQETANSNSDAWNVSYNTAYTIVVWHGGKVAETGGGHPTMHALNIWKKVGGESMQFDKFKIPQNIIKLPVDTYSTNKNMQVTLASINTPEKYIKYECFNDTNKPNSGKSMFENIDFDFNITAISDDNSDVLSNYINISFDVEDIYFYKVVRKDFTGENIIFEMDGSNLKSASYLDHPIWQNQQINYTVYVYVKNTEHLIEVGSQTKTIFL